VVVNLFLTGGDVKVSLTGGGSHTPDVTPPLRIAILASHEGTNAQAVMDACQDDRIAGVVCVVISNNSDATVLKRAEAMGIPTRHLSGATDPDPAALDRAILGELRDRDAELVLLSGYMKKLGPRTVAAFDRRIVNIHPALLPRHGGQGMYGRRVHQAVIDAGDDVTGVTVHLVDDHYDQGDVVAQREVPVRPGDDADSLAARVLPVEHELLVDTLARIAAGELLARPRTEPDQQSRRG
jgi:phosphoribosylglycinamide formyltransferase-1